MSSKLGIEWAPMSLPLERRIQTLAVFFYLSLAVLVSVCMGFNLILISLLFTRYYYISLLYAIWYAYDHQISYTGSRWNSWVRSWRVWYYISRYFPTTLIKTADLPADKNYLFGCHPHGIFGTSHFINLGTEATGFSRKFPGIKPHLVCLNYFHRCCFGREVITSLGLIAAQSQSIEHVLSKMGPGYSAAIIIGGAREVIFTGKNTMTLVLKNRKGFVKMALRNGSSLVPVMAFGENQIYETLIFKEGSFLRKIQDLLLKVLTFSPLIIYGRGIFQYTFGFLPYRKPLNVVVGKPIHTEKNPNPSQEEIDSLHQRYITELTELYDEYKTKFNYQNVPLEII